MLSLPACPVSCTYSSTMVGEEFVNVWTIYTHCKSNSCDNNSYLSSKWSHHLFILLHISKRSPSTHIILCRSGELGGSVKSSATSSKTLLSKCCEEAYIAFCLWCVVSSSKSWQMWTIPMSMHHLYVWTKISYTVFEPPIEMFKHCGNQFFPWCWPG